MSLYQKHRPSTLSEVVGNQKTISILEKYISNELEGNKTMPHALLLTGETGCGKTTISRILANLLVKNAQNYIELDAADFRGIDMVRDLRKKCQYQPMGGGRRVYLLDECHKLTGDAQNALLKLLEDPPYHTFFILATTNPQQLIPTIRGRCSHLKLNRLLDIEMSKLLRKTAKKEGVRLTVEVIDALVIASQGHPRNGLTSLENVLAASEEDRVEVAAQAERVKIDAIELARELLKPGGSWRKIAAILQGLKEENPESIRRLVIHYTQSILLKSDNERAGLMLECFIEPNFTNGFPQLVYNSYQVYKEG